MGHSEGISIKFYLSRILERVDGLQGLMVPFRKYEMDAGIKAMLVDCIPSQMGLTVDF
jgi:hypothetical protein